MIQIILLLLILVILSCCIYYVGFYQEHKEDDMEDKDVFLIVTLVILTCLTVIGILLNQKFIEFLMSFSKLMSIGAFLNKIRMFLFGRDIVTGGGSSQVISDINNLYQDDLPESEGEEFYY
jgi:tellurite resistance protein TehA-like permease